VLFNPLHVEHLASLIVEFADRDITGTFNLGASAVACPRRSSCERWPRTRPARDNFRMALSRTPDWPPIGPRDMRMDVGKARTALGHDLPTIDEGLLLSPRIRSRRAA